jgi:hypothetical protein
MTSCIMTDTTSNGITCSDVDTREEMSNPSTAETNAVAATATSSSISPDPSMTEPIAMSSWPLTALLLNVVDRALLKSDLRLSQQSAIRR